MHLLIYFVVGLILLWGLYTVFIFLMAKSARGREISGLSAASPELANLPPKALLYWHTPACGPCKTMGPVIDELCQDGAPVVKLEVSEHLELARELGIRATPTLLLVENDRVERVIIGSCTPARLRKLLA